MAGVPRTRDVWLRSASRWETLPSNGDSCRTKAGLQLCSEAPEEHRPKSLLPK